MFRALLPLKTNHLKTFRSPFLVLFILAFMHTTEAQVIRYVKPTGLMSFNYQGPHSWQNNQSYRGLQEAIMASSPGDEIWVAQGVYKSLTDSALQYGNPDPRMRVYVLKEGVKIYGGFPGLPGQEGNFSLRDPSTYMSVLSADINGDDPDPWPGHPNYQIWDPPLNDNAYAIVINQGMLTGNTVLDGFWLRGANRYNVPSGVRTGAINLSSFASPLIERCVFYNNYNLYNGGAITTYASSPKIEKCVFKFNIGSGAAISATANSLLEVNACAINSNFGGDVGGAIALYQGAKMNLTNSFFYHNHSTFGNSLFINGSHTTILTAQNCIWWGNGSFDPNTNTIQYSQASGRLFYITGSTPGSGIAKVANSVLFNNGPVYSGPSPNPSTDGNFYVDPGHTLEIYNSNVQYGFPRSGGGIITADPKFANPPTNFNVLSGSPLVNPNMPQVFFVLPYDYNGNLRDSNPDLGAYEYDPVLSANELSQIPPASLFPNPAKSHLKVESPRDYDRYEIFDLMGRRIVDAYFPVHGINLPELRSGTYLLRLHPTGSNQVESYKFQVM
jgi:hypothetical protein